MALVRRWPIARPHRLVRVAVYTLAGVLIAFGKVVADGAIREWIFGARPYLLISNLALQMAIYWALVAGAHALQRYGAARARAAEAEARLGQAQLHVLRAQLQPHFLFNALGSVAELVHEDPDRADRMIGQLSDLLRATLDVGERQEVTLAEELALLRSYVAIQQTRFGDRLIIVIDVGDDCLTARVPFLLLQPLVENAIRHGFSARAAGGGIHVAATCGGPSLVLTVEDDGVGRREGSTDGVGLTNTRGRLDAMYGDDASVTVGAGRAGGTLVTISIPARSGRIPA